MKRKPKTTLSQAAGLMGKVGGKKGGPARAVALSRHQREDIARKGGRASARAKGKG